MSNLHTKEYLKELQALSLEDKIIVSKKLIKEWYDYFDGMVYVSFSGGKDSTVLKHLVETTEGLEAVPNVFVNTGLEYPEIIKFVISQSNIKMIRPEMRFDEVIEKYGYPVISKEVSSSVCGARNSIKKGKDSIRLQKMQGRRKNINGEKSAYNYKKYEYLIDAPFKISDRCCDVMKKKPIEVYQKESDRKPYLGIMADESLLRKSNWLRYGCNAFENKKQYSAPLSFWSENDILKYLADNKIPYANCYGEIKQDENGNYYTTGVKRTGCMFCMFGVHLEKEPNRFRLMKKTHPAQYDFCIKKLGIGEVLDYIGVKY